MNRIKEVLEERGIKQTWLAEKLGKVPALSTHTLATDDNPVWRYCLR